MSVPKEKRKEKFHKNNEIINMNDTKTIDDIN
jgi:hypothetical protein